MNTRKFNLVVLACLLAAPVLSAAQATGQGSASAQVAVINIQQAIGETNAGKQALANLRQKYAPRQQALQTQQKAITALQDKLQNQSTMLSDSERYTLSRELDEKQRHFKDNQQDAQDDMQADEQEAITKIGQKMVKVISQYARQHHFSLVIGDQQVPVYYAAKTIDITQPIVALYNKMYPVATASASAAPASAPTSVAKGDKPAN